MTPTNDDRRHATARVDQVDPLLEEAVFEALRDAPPDGFPEEPGAEDIAAVRKERADLARRRQVTVELELEPHADRSHLRALRAGITDRIASLDDQIESLTSSRARLSALSAVRAARDLIEAVVADERVPDAVEMGALLSMRAAWAAHWADLTVAERRTLIAATLSITINSAATAAKPPRYEIRPVAGELHSEMVQVDPGRPGPPRFDIRPPTTLNQEQPS